MARELYSTLSRTIHNFQPSKDFNQYTVMPGQFDPMQIDFMKVMEPKRENLKADGSPDWEKERNRYPGQVLDAARERERQRPQGGGKEVSDSGQNDDKKGKKSKKATQNKGTESITPAGWWNVDDENLAQIDRMAKEKGEGATLQGRQTAALEKLANAVTKYLKSEDKSEDESDGEPDDR